MISLLQSFPPSKEIDEIPYCGLSSSKEVDDFLPAGFSQVMKLCCTCWLLSETVEMSGSILPCKILYLVTPTLKNTQ